MAHLLNPPGWHTCVTLLQNMTDTFDHTQSRGRWRKSETRRSKSEGSQKAEGRRRSWEHRRNFRTPVETAAPTGFRQLNCCPKKESRGASKTGMTTPARSALWLVFALPPAILGPTAIEVVLVYLGLARLACSCEARRVSLASGFRYYVDKMVNGITHARYALIAAKPGKAGTDKPWRPLASPDERPTARR